MKHLDILHIHDKKTDFSPMVSNRSLVRTMLYPFKRIGLGASFKYKTNKWQPGLKVNDAEVFGSTG